MTAWTLIDTHPTNGRTFQRVLSPDEHGFFLKGLTNGTTDALEHYELHLHNGSDDAELFSEANVARAWISTKRRYPLSGATVQGQEGLESSDDSKTENGDGANDTLFGTHLYFVVREGDLSCLLPDEIVFGKVADSEGALQFAAAILNGPRPLSPKLLVKLYVLREADSEKARSDVLHVMLLGAHCVRDGMANKTFMRCLLDTLARSGRPDSEPAQLPLEDRLAMVTPWMQVERMDLHAMSPARRRWRRVLGTLAYSLKLARLLGGHTLPCRMTRSTLGIPAHLGTLDTSLTQEQSKSVLAECRRHKVTFGNAYLVLAQVAMTRVLYRRYLRGEISEEEWEYRKRQPHLTGGPINMRPYVDEAWHQGGGAGEFMLSIGAYVYQLPSMSLGVTDKQLSEGSQQDKERILLDGAPPFSDLLSFKRFLYRCGLVKQQVERFLGHPLFIEMMHSMHGMFVEYQRPLTRQWVERTQTDDHNNSLDEREVLAVVDMRGGVAHGGSSFGNMDPMLPFEYPIPRTNELSPNSLASHPRKTGYVVPPSSASLPSDADKSPRISIEYTRIRHHVAPGELYLGAFTWRGQTTLTVNYDCNVYEDVVVKEWLEEVKEAMLWYLGGSRVG